MSDNVTLQELRSRAQAVAERAKIDPAYREQIKSDPFGVLGAAGIPEDEIRTLVEAKTQEPDVAGYRYDSECNATTCWSSACPECCICSY